MVGNLIAEALDQVGADGVLSIETSNSLETTVEVQEGMLIDRGYISPQFVTNLVGLCATIRFSPLQIRLQSSCTASSAQPPPASSALRGAVCFLKMVLDAARCRA